MAKDTAARLREIVRELHPGSALPPHSLLASRLDVSRSTVAAALHSLAKRGLVEARRGRCARAIGRGPQITPAVDEPVRAS